MTSPEKRDDHPLLICVAVYGVISAFPGLLRTKDGIDGRDCYVTHAFPERVVDKPFNIDMPVGDCTVFQVSIPGAGDDDFFNQQASRALMDKSLEAVNEVIIWSKAHEQVGKHSQYARQIGITDVKFWAARGTQSSRMVVWVNTNSRSMLQAATAFMSGMRASNGPDKKPVPTVVRRVMASIDLVNMGFFTEAFVTLFALVDDLSQEIIKAGLDKRGLNQSEQKETLRSIKESRLRVFLCNLSKLCGWESLAEARPDLLKRVLVANTTRNNIMHGPGQLTRDQCLGHMKTMLELIDWLRTNPFGYAIAGFPRLKLADPNFQELTATDSIEPERPDEAQSPG